VNNTDLTTGLQTYNNGPRGGIIYVPAYPGAAFGNMSVNFGDLPTNASDPTSILASFVAYAGGYVVYPDNDTVIHYPDISSNAKVPVGSTVIRRFQFVDSMFLFPIIKYKI
jgi:hypothetical protein